MAKVLGIASTGLRRFLREKENVFFVFIFPILIILFVGLQFGSGVAASLGVVGGDTPVGRAIVAAVEAEGFDVVEMADRAAALEAVEFRSVEAAIMVEDADPLTSTNPVEVGFAARAGFGLELRQVVEAAIADLSVERRAERYLVDAGGLDADAAADAIARAVAGVAPVDVELSIDEGAPLFAGEMEQFDLGASSQLVLFTFLTSLSTSGHLILTRHLGVSARMVASPTAVRSIVVGETLGRYGVALVQALFIVVATALMFGVDWGDPLGAAAVIGVFALVSTSAGILLGSMLDNDQQAGGIGVMLGIGLGALGGAMVPYEIFPDAVQAVSRWTPHYWTLRAFRSLLFTDGTFADVLLEVGVLGVFAVVLLSVATWAYRRSITA